jgi:hypothetical protein
MAGQIVSERLQRRNQSLAVHGSPSAQLSRYFLSNQSLLAVAMGVNPARSGKGNRKMIRDIGCIPVPIFHFVRNSHGHSIIGYPVKFLDLTRLRNVFVVTKYGNFHEDENWLDLFKVSICPDDQENRLMACFITENIDIFIRIWK